MAIKGLCVTGAQTQCVGCAKRLYNYHLTGQNSYFAKIMAKITHYQAHSAQCVGCAKRLNNVCVQPSVSHTGSCSCAHGTTCAW